MVKHIDVIRFEFRWKNLAVKLTIGLRRLYRIMRHVDIIRRHWKTEATASLHGLIVALLS